jgi:glycosyltransferase involved in cell wall biosynthesis
MNVTVAICTWNRAKLLDQTLEQMAKLRVPEGLGWELLVVNNNCTDDSDAIIVRHADRLPLRRLFEREQGQSAARNCAIDAARGELIIWTDDDVLVAPDWLAEYVKAAEAWPDAAFFGGTIEPWFEAEPPPWLRQHVAGMGYMFAIRVPVPHGELIARNDTPYGANMAMRKQAFESARFDNRFSRKKDGHVRGDEIVLLRRLVDCGLHGRWVATARVKHYIPAERMTPRYIWDYHVGQGVECARMDPKLLPGRSFLGWPLWSHRVYWSGLAQECLLRPFKTGRWLSALCWAARGKGHAQEYRRARRESQRAAPHVREAVGVTQ